MIRFRIVVSVVGLIVQGFSAVLIVPMLVAMMVGQNDSAFAILLGMLSGILAGRVAWRAHREQNFDDLNRIEGMAAVGLSWLTVAMIGAIPYMCFGFGFFDSLFEAMSGFTTTGATILMIFPC